MKISKMTIEDLKSIENILLEKYDDFWSINIFQKEIENSEFICVKENNEILGFAGVTFLLDGAEITNIVVRKDRRGKGIGYLLLEKIIKICEEKNIGVIRLEVNEKNVPAISLYKKFNFSTVGIRKKYYKNSDNAILMDLNLKNSKKM